VRCEAIAESLPGAIDGTARLDRAERRHVEHCLRCQAELARYRKLLRALRSLRTDVGPVPDGLVDAIWTHVETAGERGAVRATLTGRRAAYLGGIAAATAAGAGAALVLARRARPALAS
jgi:hypothetical protein